MTQTKSYFAVSTDTDAKHTIRIFFSCESCKASVAEPFKLISIPECETLHFSQMDEMFRFYCPFK